MLDSLPGDKRFAVCYWIPSSGTLSQECDLIYDLPSLLVVLLLLLLLFLLSFIVHLPYAVYICISFTSQVTPREQE